MTKQDWRTPNTKEQPIVSLVQVALGGVIGIDPTADDGRTVPANRHITAQEDCLEATWECDPKTCYMNPPYSKPYPFLERLVQMKDAGYVDHAIALCKMGVLANRKSGVLIDETAEGICIFGPYNSSPWSRIRFLDDNGNHGGSADFDTVFIYWSNHLRTFVDAFEDWGSIWR